ncbi:hypothetical protein Tco_0859172 [Tanacetum coccineum]|uniref:BZIP domain-containing protein n=1 Tax=Tanacetum coccineum TaxID=301880 RepID=A0ABQ5BBB7_9ASTR
MSFRWSIGHRCKDTWVVLILDIMALKILSHTFCITLWARNLCNFEQVDNIPSEDPYEEATRQLLKHAPRSPEYVPDPMELEDHVASAPPPPPSFLPSLIRPPRTRAAMAQMRAAAPSTYHPLLPSGTPPLLAIPLPTPSTSRRANIPEADTPPQKRLLLTAPRPRCEGPENTERRMNGRRKVVNAVEKDRAAVRAEIEVLRRERLAYKQESIQTRQDLARFEAYSRALEARVTVLDTDKYGYIKNHKKIVKNGQTKTRGTEEHKRSQRCKAKSRKSQKSQSCGQPPGQTSVNKSQP